MDVVGKKGREDMILNFNLANGHNVIITDVLEGPWRGLDDCYKVSFFEDGRQLFNSEYMGKDAIYETYGIKF